MMQETFHLWWLRQTWNGPLPVCAFTSVTRGNNSIPGLSGVCNEAESPSSAVLPVSKQVLYKGHCGEPLRGILRLGRFKCVSSARMNMVASPSCV